VIGLAAFPVIERRSRAPLVPLRMFRSKQFAGANLVTLLVYAALSGTTFLLPLQLQQSMGYSALDSGASLLPFTVLMLLLAGRIGALAQRVGARGAMTVGPVVVGVGLALLVRAVPGESYFGGVFPGVLVFGLGMSITVPPLTSTVLAAVPEDNVGAASGTNNAVSRVAGLLAVAVLPVAAGVDTHGSLGPGFGRAVLIGAVLCLVAGFAAFLTVDRSNRAGRTDDQVEVMSAPSS
jgi:MFS family permease